LKFEAISFVNTIVFWVNNMYDEQAENNRKKQRESMRKIRKIPLQKQVV
jgi:hypothetical protein